jgi:NADPH:quinone reductase-like Zn-dependent oxidoreductase
MNAIVQHAYGSPDVLQLAEIEKPVAGADQVLVRMRAAALNPADWHFMRGLPYIMRPQTGLRGPKNAILGRDIAGEVEAVGADVTRFRAGDAVFGTVDAGGFAEYACVPEAALAPKPANLSFEEAAAVPVAALTALQGLRDAGRLEPGQKALIVGASGGVGTFAVQIAKWLGAEVTAVCSTRNVELVRSLGADRVIDYTQEDFVQPGQAFDLILQVAGSRSPAECRRALTPKGTLVLISGDSSGRWIGPVDRILASIALSLFVRQRLGPMVTKPSEEGLQLLRELVEAGTVKPVIDRVHPLAELPAAMRYLEEGHARGKVVITI